MAIRKLSVYDKLWILWCQKVPKGPLTLKICLKYVVGKKIELIKYIFYCKITLFHGKQF